MSEQPRRRRRGPQEGPAAFAQSDAPSLLQEERWTAPVQPPVGGPRQTVWAEDPDDMTVRPAWPKAPAAASGQPAWQQAPAAAPGQPAWPKAPAAAPGQPAWPEPPKQTAWPQPPAAAVPRSETGGRLSAAFLILMLVYVVLNMLDGAPVWDRIIGGLGLYRTIPHTILTLGLWRGKGTRYRIGAAIPGVFFAVFPFLAVVFIHRGKKAPACIFAGLHLVFSLICAYVVFQIWLPLGLAWLLGVASAVLLLLCALDVIGSKKTAAVMCLVMGAVSIALCALFCCFRVGMTRGDRFVGLAGIRRLLATNRTSKVNIWWGYYISNHPLGVLFFPISRAVMQFALGAGLLSCGGRKKMAAGSRDASPVYTGNGRHYNGKYPLLDQYKRDHRM